jgi:hypothetical protein
LDCGHRCIRIGSCITDNQVDPGTAERFDAPGRVNVVGDEFDPVAAIDAKLGIGSG